MRLLIWHGSQETESSRSRITIQRHASSEVDDLFNQLKPRELGTPMEDFFFFGLDQLMAEDPT